MTRLSRFSVVTLTALLLAAGVTAFAQAPAPPPEPGGPGGPGMMRGPGGPGGPPGDPPPVEEWWANPRVAERLNLTEAQRNQIEELIYQNGQKLIDLRAENHKARMNLNHLLGAETLDRGAIQKAVDRLANAECALHREQITLRAEIAGVLDRAQRIALRDLVRERMGARWQERQERRRGGTD